MASAWAIGLYFRDHALAAYSYMGTNDDVQAARRILAWITRHKLTEFTRKACQRGLGVERVGDLDAPLAVLQERNLIREKKANTNATRGRGRPAGPAYEVQPPCSN